MTPLSARHGAALVLILGLGLLPWAAHRNPRLQDSCANPEALRATSMIAGSHALGERLERRGPGVIQWSEGEIDNPLFPKQPLEFQIVRAYGLRRVYERPVTFVSGVVEPEQHGIQEVETSAGPLPVHILHDQAHQPGRVVAYFHVYENRPVAHPFLALLASAPRRLLTGSRPMSFFIVAGVAPRRNAEPVEQRARDWLAAAWEYYDAVCQP